MTPTTFGHNRCVRARNFSCDLKVDSTMKHLQTYKRYLLQGLLAATLALPAVGWGHGAVDIPIARQVNCKLAGGEWQSPDGSSIPDRGCREAAAIFSTPAERAYPAQQWNEVAMLVPDYNNDNAVMAAIPNGKLCAAGDPKKASLDVVTPYWHKTALTASDSMTVRIIGTAPHVPSFAKIYLSKASYDGTRPLGWDDLDLIHSERFTTARTDWQTQPTISGASGFFEVKAPLPPGRTGDAVVYVRWQREDPAGEGFYNCSDITFKDTGIPEPELFDKGSFIPAEIQPKAGDTVRFRVLSGSGDAHEIVDVKQAITAQNTHPNVWGKQIFDKVPPSNVVIGEEPMSRAKQHGITFNESDWRANSVFVRNRNDSPAMSISSGGEPEPVNPNPPIVVIEGPTTVKSGEQFTLDGSKTQGQNGNGSLRYQWIAAFAQIDGRQPIHQFTAPTVTTPTAIWARLAVDDSSNHTVAQKTHNITVTPATGGGDDFPAYSPGTSYKPGDKVSHKGKNYQCRDFPNSGWCGQSPTHYEPGVGSDWRDAWNPL